MFKFSSELTRISRVLANTGRVGVSIIDGENAINTPRVSERIFSNFFSDCTTNNHQPIIVAKVSNLDRLKKRIPKVEIPVDVIYYFLHGDNKTCPDDAFIIELYSNIKSTLKVPVFVFSRDNYKERNKWLLPRTMISSDNNPKRPRYATQPGVENYHPDQKVIAETELGTDHRAFRI